MPTIKSSTRFNGRLRRVRLTFGAGLPGSSSTRFTPFGATPLASNSSDAALNVLSTRARSTFVKFTLGSTMPVSFCMSGATLASAATSRVRSPVTSGRCQLRTTSSSNCSCVFSRGTSRLSTSPVKACARSGPMQSTRTTRDTRNVECGGICMNSRPRGGLFFSRFGQRETNRGHSGGLVLLP